MKKIFALILALGFLSATACSNTIEGLGKDIEDLGKSMQDNGKEY